MWSFTVLALSAVLLPAGAGAIGAVDPNTSSWKRAREALEKKDWAVAAAHFRSYRAGHPLDTAGWILEAWTRRESGQIEEADRLFEGVLALDPRQPDALMHVAERAWAARDTSRTLRILETIQEVPPHLLRTYHHLLGVVLVLEMQHPRRAIHHLEASTRQDAPTLTLLALAYLRAGDDGGARPLLERLCPPAPGEFVQHAWLTCLDADYCGDILDQRLEILTRLLSQSSPARSDLDVAEAVRVFIRHGRPAGKLLEILRGAVARRPEACRLYVLDALAQDIPPGSAPAEACASLVRAKACMEGTGEAQTPAFSGPLFDPATGAVLDPTRFGTLVPRLIESRCRPSAGASGSGVSVRSAP